MAKARAIVKRLKAVKNIRKITRTMELIATARFKKAMDRASAATAYTKRITALVADLARSGLEVSHPLLEPRSEIRHATLLVLTGNRGLCGGYNSNVQRAALPRLAELKASVPQVPLQYLSSLVWAMSRASRAFMGATQPAIAKPVTRMKSPRRGAITCAGSIPPAACASLPSLP